MYRLMYLSTSTVKFTDEDYEVLLDVARKNNQEKGVTGLLIIKGRSFLQCLEGNKEDVLYIYEKIEQDDRHKDIIKVVEEEDEKRYFPNWSMGYKNFGHLDVVNSEKLINFSKIENIRNLSSDLISDVFKEFIELNT